MGRELVSASSGGRVKRLRGGWVNREEGASMGRELVSAGSGGAGETPAWGGWVNREEGASRRAWGGWVKWS